MVLDRRWKGELDLLCPVTLFGRQMEKRNLQ
jgi:hypothetical protein